MTCHDFQQKWHELLDAESAAGGCRGTVGTAVLGSARSSVDDAEALLLAHAADCPTCRPIAARYQVLRQAIRVWRQPPIPPIDLVQRVLSVPAGTMPRTWRTVAAERARMSWRDSRTRRRLLLAGVAATAMVGLLLPVRMGRRGRPAPPAAVDDVADRGVHSIARPKSPPVLDRAVAEATSATWDLARSASEPAARISREVLDAGPTVGDASARPTVAATDHAARLSLTLMMPSLDPLGRDPTAASAVIREVSDRFAAGVEPISDTARHAFGFLLGRARPRAGTQGRQPIPAGARSG